MKKPETKFKEIVMKDLKTLANAYFFKTQERSRRGIPDIIGHVKGHFFALELKTLEGHPSELQIHTLRMMMVKGAEHCYLVDPVSWPRVLKELRYVDQS